MNEPTVWWILAGSLMVVELLTGTFYLLMMSIGVIAAALSAHAGVSTTGQIVVAALISGGAVAGWHWFKKQQPAELRATANHNVNLDIGSIVVVHHWDKSHKTTVKYRGADWAACLLEGEAAVLGEHRIVEVLGSQLVLQAVNASHDSPSSLS